jgi:hypothetical protein
MRGAAAILGPERENTMRIVGRMTGIKLLILTVTVVSMLIVGPFNSSPANAEPIPAFDSQRLLALSTHIAVVLVLSDEKWLEIPQVASAAYTVKVTVRVRDRIKGNDLPDVLTLTLTRPDRAFDGGGPLPAGATVLAFLARSPDTQEWRPSDPYYGLFRVSGSRPSKGLIGDARRSTLAELRNSLDDADFTVVDAALNALTAFRDHDAIQKATVLSKSEDVRVAAHALSLRFALGDTNGLNDAVHLIEDETGLTPGERDLLAWSIAEKESRVENRELSHLLLNSTYPTLRTVAATLLSRRGDRTSIPALLVGLGDTDRETQYRSLVGLSRITGRPGPGYREFMLNSGRIVDEWKQWGASELTK